MSANAIESKISSFSVCCLGLLQIIQWIKFVADTSLNYRIIIWDKNLNVSLFSLFS